MLSSLKATKAQLSSTFLPNWFIYYQVLGNFTRPLQVRLGEAEADSPWLWQISEPNKFLVCGQPLLNCTSNVCQDHRLFGLLHRGL